jgi:hypothetical protein
MKATTLAMTLLPAALAAAIATLPASATEYYKWLDERGQLVISDRPPVDPTIDYEYHGERFGRTPTRLFDSDAEPARGKVVDNGTAVKSPPTAERRPTARPARDLDEEKCAAARERLFKLETFPRKRVEEDGEIRFMTDEEVEEQLRINRELVERHCPPA